MQLSMQLREMSLISPEIVPGELLQAIETVIPRERIDQAIEATNSQEQRNRRLPTHVVVALVIALHFCLKILSQMCSRTWWMA